MNTTPAELLRFRAAVCARLGLAFDDWQIGFLEGVLRGRLESRHLDPDTYLLALETHADADELGAIARAVTVPETHFFRNIDQFRALREAVLPERMRARERVRHLRILSAGCASGEEPYTLAMILHDALPVGWTLDLRACDVNPDILARAMAARFSPWALRETPESALRWFSRRGNESILDPSIRALVKFSRQNLADEAAEIWSPDTWDIVFCRNVTMYFSREVARAVVRRFEKALVPGGFLFLGHAESLRSLSDEFELCHTHGTFYYQRRSGSLPRRTSAFPAAAIPLEQREEAAPFEVDGSWVAKIRDSTERVRALTEPDVRPATIEPELPRWDFASLLELVREERFEEALEKLGSLPKEKVDNPDVLILHASLLAHRGDFAGAQHLCNRLLELDEWNAGAHYVLALCDEGRGDVPSAIAHDRTASRLDPRFAMPRLHLGLLARRAGDRDGARRELHHALGLFESEEPRRVLLFGGGFTREALVALCRSELSAAGGEP